MVIKLALTALLGLLVLGPVAYAGDNPDAKWWATDGRLNWDVERQPIDTIVIHHTGVKSGATLQELSDSGYDRLYVPRFNPGISGPTIPAGTPIQSGHYRADGKEVFYAFHWLIRQDGGVERLLQDDEVGWHAGNWDINCRSIAICFDGDYSSGPPSDAALTACTWLINYYQAKYNIKQVGGHNDYRKIGPTACPGSWFYGEGKDKLLASANQLTLALRGE